MTIDTSFIKFSRQKDWHHAQSCGNMYLQGRITCGYADVCAVFGDPTEPDCDKTKAEWWIKFSDGLVACIYDYKYHKKYGYNGRGTGLELSAIRNWHVACEDSRGLFRTVDLLDLPDGAHLCEKQVSANTWAEASRLACWSNKPWDC